jgi:hypothetical protein
MMSWIILFKKFLLPEGFYSNFENVWNIFYYSRKKLKFVCFFFLFWKLTKFVWKLYILIYIFNIIKNTLKKLCGLNLIILKPIFIKYKIRYIYRVTNGLSIQVLTNRKFNKLFILSSLWIIVIQFILGCSLVFLNLYFIFIDNMCSYYWDKNKSIFINFYSFLCLISASMDAAFYDKFIYLESIR